MTRRGVLGLMLASLTWPIAGCGEGGEDSKLPEGGVAAPGSPVLPGVAEAGIEVSKKKKPNR